MKAILITINQAIVIGFLSLVLSVGINEVRGKDHLSLSRQYFRDADINKTGTDTGSQSGGHASTQPGPKTVPDQDATANTDDENKSESPQNGDAKRPFDVVSLDQAVDIWQDEKTQYGMYVFVDARDDDWFESGHIPGAVQCDYYRIEHYMGEVYSRVAGAEKVVVYCNGGDCEDSLLVCGELLRMDVPRDNIYLFKGGWDAWKKSGMPVSENGEGAQ